MIFYCGIGIACAAVVQSFMTVVFCPAQGITTGCGTIFSYHCGGGNYSKIRQVFLGVFLLCGACIGLLQAAVQVFPQMFTGLFLRDSGLNQQASASIRMYTLVLLGVAVQYALVDGLTAMGKVRYAFPLSVFGNLYVWPAFFAAEGAGSFVRILCGKHLRRSWRGLQLTCIFLFYQSKTEEFYEERYGS